MATPAVTYTFAANTLVKASEANTNFQDIIDFLTTHVIQKDASVAFTATPSGPSTDPTGDDQFTRKKYVDDLGLTVPRSKAATVTGANGNITSTANFTALPVNLQVASFVKRSASSRLHVSVGSGVYNNNGLGTFIVGVRISGVDYPVYGSIGSSMGSGEIEIEGLGAATYTVQVRARVGNGAGTAVQLLTPMTVRVAEVY